MRGSALLLTLATALVGGADAQGGRCGFEKLLSVDSVLSTCCESTAAKDCSKGFPKTCNLECAKLLVPVYNGCYKTLAGMPKGHFKFAISDLKSFTQNCEHMQELFHHSSSKCADNAKEKEQRVLDVTAACCNQGGNFVCKNGMPWTCNAECASTFVPFYDQCVRKDKAVGMKSMHKYTKLYEACANMNGTEVGILLADLDKLVGNPLCRVNTSSIRSRGKPFKFPQFGGGNKKCKDDDNLLGKKYPGTSCLSAAAHDACGLPGVSAICGCACAAASGKVSCSDNDKGLQQLYGPSVSCYSAAIKGACSKKGYEKVARLCTCACDDDQHRRLQDKKPQLKPSEPNLGFDKACAWDSFDDKLRNVTKVCCPAGGCSDTLPTHCNFMCGLKLSAFMADCHDLFEALVIGTDQGDAMTEAMVPYDKFLQTCHNLDPRSLATAVYTAQCAECGNGRVEPWTGEQCDEGPKNDNSGSCSLECKKGCPKLTATGGMKVRYDHDKGLKFAGTKAAYTCANYPAIYNGVQTSGLFQYLKKGQLPTKVPTRTCQGNSTWSGKAPITCAIQGSWSSGSYMNRQSNYFKLYRMAPTKGFTYSAAGAQKYKAICDAVGLKTVGSGYSTYWHNCRSQGCIPVGCSGGCQSYSHNTGQWGSSSDIVNYIYQRTSWPRPSGSSNKYLMFAYNTPRPYAYSDSTSIRATTMYTPVCGSENEIQQVWSSGSVKNRHGNPFKLYRMACREGYWSHSRSSADNYQKICEAQGLRTIGSGYSNYINHCKKWNCMPVGCSGGCPSASASSWGSTSDVDDNIRSRTGWNYGSIFLHNYNNGYPYNYPWSTSFSSNQPFCPVCGSEKPIQATWSSGSVKNRNGKTFKLYRMACDSGYRHNVNGANAYKRICEKAGLLTVGSGYGSGGYYQKCKSKWGCMPLPCSGGCSKGVTQVSGWGSTSDIDDNIRSRTGWTSSYYRLLVHGTGNGYPHVYPDNSGVNYNNPYCPVCAKEN